MADCADVVLTGDDPDCPLPAGGTEPAIYIAKLEDIDDYTEDAEGIITSISMVAGKYFAKYVGFRNDIKKTDESVQPAQGPRMLKHGAGWVIYTRTQAMKNEIETLLRSKVVAVLANNGQDAAAWEVLGKTVGLEMVAGPIRNAHENGGFFTINFATPTEDGVFEPKLPQTFGPDYDTAKLALESYLAP